MLKRVLFWLMVLLLVVGINVVSLIPSHPHSGMFAGSLASLVALVIVLTTRRFFFPESESATPSGE